MTHTHTWTRPRTQRTGTEEVRKEKSECTGDYMPLDTLIAVGGGGRVGRTTQELKRREIGVCMIVRIFFCVSGVELMRGVLVRNKPEIDDGIQVVGLGSRRAKVCKIKGPTVADEDSGQARN
jgi:hypothetical protein